MIYKPASKIKKGDTIELGALGRIDITSSAAKGKTHVTIKGHYANRDDCPIDLTCRADDTIPCVDEIEAAAQRQTRRAADKSRGDKSE